jgi:ABC-type antimicrobial peptide transport system permease subunit
VRERGQPAAVPRDDAAQELSVRLSLGATRARLVRQLLTESLLLAFIGGVLGILVGYYGKLLLPPPVNQAALIDWRVIGFVFGVTTLTGLCSGSRQRSGPRA